MFHTQVFKHFYSGACKDLGFKTSWSKYFIMARKRKIQYPYGYDPEKRRKAKAYSRVKIMSGLLNGMLIPVVFLLGFFFLGYSFQLKTLIGDSIFLVPAFILAILVILTLVELPLKFYSSYLYEHKYKLSRMNKRAWFKEFSKETALEYILSVPVLTLVYFIMGFDYWWAWAAVLYFFLDIFLDTIYPVVILPLFYKLSPFKNTGLKKKLLAMARSAGSKNIDDVLVAKESDKSVKANAMFTGLGKTKKMVLFDTLLDNFTEPEVETVIGHELGHYVHKHIMKGIILGTALLFPVFFAIHLLLSWAPGLAAVNDIAGLPLFFVGLEILALITMPLENSYSRKLERQADWFGLEASKKPVAQISTEKRLADICLSDDKPHPAVEWLLYTHPAASKRIQMVKEWEKSRKGKGKS